MGRGSNQNISEGVKRLPPTALIVVDAQPDFMPGGALAVPNGDEIIPNIEAVRGEYDCMVATRDWHPSDHCSFEAQGGIWPEHCVADTPGAQIHASVMELRPDWIISKGEDKNQEAYSGFANPKLANVLNEHGIKDVAICGLATDYCVKATALDAVKAGFNVTLLANACRAVNVNPGDAEAAVEEMREAGVTIR